MPAKKEISLLPDEENANTFSARAIRWITSVGRFVIVFTELIVICAFLSRFWLDRTNSDLSEVIRQQKAILESTSDFEKDFSLLQRRLKIIKGFYQNQPDYQTRVDALTVSTPLDINYKNLKITNNLENGNVIADISLSAYKESSIIDFVTNLVVNPSISKVSILSIDKKPREAFYNVNLSLVFAKDKK
jgi:hypothetical protein